MPSGQPMAAAGRRHSAGVVGAQNRAEAAGVMGRRRGGADTDPVDQGSPSGAKNHVAGPEGDWFGHSTVHLAQLVTAIRSDST